MERHERRMDIELTELKQDLLRMASLAETAIGKSVRALVVRDRALAEEIFVSEEEINRLEIQVDERGLRLLALHQPEAGDLRFIVMALKISTDLERIGDLAVNVAQRVIVLLQEPPLKPLIDIPRMAELVQRMLKDSLDSFVRRLPDLARDVCRRDDEVDDLNNQVFRELMTYMLQDPHTISRALNLILIGRHLERVADHATNIAEDVIYMIQGKSIKHHAADTEGPAGL
jgi:phosphate transport system protein